MLKSDEERKEVIHSLLNLDETEIIQIIMICDNGTDACLNYFAIIDFLPDNYRVSLYDGGY